MAVDKELMGEFKEQVFFRTTVTMLSLENREPVVCEMLLYGLTETLKSLNLKADGSQLARVTIEVDAAPDLNEQS